MQTQNTTSPLYYVRSETDPTHFYAVTTDARGLLRCECKSSQYRRNPCKHCRQVVAGTVKATQPKRRPTKNWTLVAPQPVPVPAPRPHPVTQADVDELYGVPA